MPPEYDAAGRLTRAGDDQTAVAYEYDAGGLVSSATESGPAVGASVTTAYAHDAAGRITSATVSVNGAIDHVEDFTFDAQGREVRVTQRGVAGGAAVAQERVDFAYGSSGKLATVTRYADLAGAAPAATSSYTYDPSGRLTGIATAQGATPLANYGYSYGPAAAGGTGGGTPAQPGGAVASFTDGSDAAGYSYDGSGQLVGVAGGGAADASYSYDANGNPSGAGYVVGLGNEVLADPHAVYSYDAEGNRTRKVDRATGGATDYRWDARNRLVGVDVSTATGQAVTSTRYAYDALNDRVGRVVTDGTGAVVSSERYAAQARTLSAPTVTAGETSQAAVEDLSVVLGPDGSVLDRYLFGPEVDQVLAEEAPGRGTRWLVADKLGSVRAEVARDASTGQSAVVKRVDYDAFGKVVSDSNPAVAARFGYTGREYDAAAGLQYNRARYYDAGLGQWASEDPKGYAAGDPNLHRYVANGVTEGTDPSGQDGGIAGWVARRFWATERDRSDELDIRVREANAPKFDAAGLPLAPGIWSNSSGGTINGQSYQQAGEDAAAAIIGMGVAVSIELAQQYLGGRVAQFGVHLMQKGWRAVKDGSGKVIGYVTSGGQKVKPAELLEAAKKFCFPAGTLVSTEYGHKPIEQVVAGDRVWAFDCRLLRWELKPVLETFTPWHQGAMATLRFAGESIRATGGHPFWVVRGDRLAMRPHPAKIDTYEDGSKLPGRWVLAQDLVAGDEVFLRSSAVVALDSVRLDDIGEQVYNFSVAGLANYAVGNSGVLVHNDNSVSRAIPPRGTVIVTNHGNYVPRVRDFEHALNPEHVKTALREKNGIVTGINPVTGKAWDHLTETRNSMNGAKRHILQLQKFLGHSDLTPEVRAVAEAELGLLSRMLDSAEKILLELAR